VFVAVNASLGHFGAVFGSILAVTEQNYRTYRDSDSLMNAVDFNILP
jgi:hypothetical protein